jgi:hypothetical protein
MIEQIILSSLIMLFIHVLMMEGMLLYKLRSFLDRYLPSIFKKPLYECLICMTSFWGTLLWFEYEFPGIVPFTWLEFICEFAWFVGSLEKFILFLFAVGGVNTILAVLLKNMVKEKEPIRPDLVQKVEFFIESNDTVISQTMRELYDYARDCN